MILSCHLKNAIARTSINCTLIGTIALSTWACKHRDFNNTANESAFQNGLLFAKNFGLSEGEVVITLDDGPGPLSVPVAKYLKGKNVPTVFFFNYKNVGDLTDPKQLQYLKDICDLKIHSISNHRDTHDAYATSNNVWKNLDDVHRAIKKTCPNEKEIFFRPPGGAWARGEDSKGNAIALNKAFDNSGKSVGLQYIGPVFWDIACDTEADCNSTDWKKLRDNYFSRIVKDGKCKGGIVLAHDIHTRSVRALSGYAADDLSTALSGSFDDSEGLISKLSKAGCKFVALDKNKDVIQKLLKNGPGIGSIPSAPTTAPTTAPSK